VPKKRKRRLTAQELNLKGPKHEIFESGFFTEIIPVRIGDLGTGKKNEISEVGVFILRPLL
jgi:hypothetical protein